MDDQQTIQTACTHFENDPKRMLDILWEVQNKLGWISPKAMQSIAEFTGTYRVEVEGVVTFYAFFMTQPQGKFIIRLCEDIIDRHAGMPAVQIAFEEILNIKTGETTKDGLFSLHLTPCIGMSDQVPAALINNKVVTHLSPNKAKKIIRTLKKTRSIDKITSKFGDGNNSHELIKSMVNNNIKLFGDVLLADIPADVGLMKAFSISPQEVIDRVRESKLKGRGGAGFLTATKWQFAADTVAEERYIICNADEGEPGTFKDRVLLTERAHLLIEGMTISGYAIGSRKGILYLRAEFLYLQPYLESVIRERYDQGLLGKDILVDESEATRFSFDIRIQLGAGAYICGEESSLIQSCEGKRGEPTNKPPFPAQSGYLQRPTIVNNVETFCNIPRILEKGALWFSSIGTDESCGTKLLSICGDCTHPGIYEFPMGVTLNEVITLAGAKNPEAIQVGGASGVMVGRADFERQLCFEDLPTAGAIMIFSSHRNILDIVDNFMHFFIEESCGYCTPCRVGNVFLKKGLEKIMAGQAEQKDLIYLENLGETVIQTSRCGLGHTSPKPLLSSMKNFPLVYAALLKEHPDGMQAGFNIQHALDESRIIAKRRSIIYDPDLGGSE
jgi:[NiFe] hydrogenase diaphorase moiety large subunit